MLKSLQVEWWPKALLSFLGLVVAPCLVEWRCHFQSDQQQPFLLLAGILLSKAQEADCQMFPSALISLMENLHLLAK